MIDENDAPEGYKAVEPPNVSCVGCAFEAEEACVLDENMPSCMRKYRRDRQYVIFVKRDPA